MRTCRVRYFLPFLLLLMLLALTGCGDKPAQEYARRYPGEYNTSLSDYSSIKVTDRNGTDISSIAIDLWYAANEIYNVDDMKMFEIGEYEVNLSEYEGPSSNELLNYSAVVENVFTPNGIAELEATKIGGPAPLIRKQDGKVYRMSAWKTGYSFAHTLMDMQVKETSGDTVVLSVIYALVNFDNDILATVATDFTIADVGGVWLVDAYVYPEADRE